MKIVVVKIFNKITYGLKMVAFYTFLDCANVMDIQEINGVY